MVPAHSRQPEQSNLHVLGNALHPCADTCTGLDGRATCTFALWAPPPLTSWPPCPCPWACRQSRRCSSSGTSPALHTQGRHWVCRTHGRCLMAARHEADGCACSGTTVPAACPALPQAGRHEGVTPAVGGRQRTLQRLQRQHCRRAGRQRLGGEWARCLGLENTVVGAASRMEELLGRPQGSSTQLVLCSTPCSPSTVPTSPKRS